MICFGVKTDQKVKENGTYGSHLKKKNLIRRRERGRGEQGRLVLFFYFYFLSLLSSIYGNRTVEIRRARTKRLYSTRATRENQKQ